MDALKLILVIVLTVALFFLMRKPEVAPFDTIQPRKVSFDIPKPDLEIGRDLPTYQPGEKKKTVKPEDLIPKDNHSVWATVNPDVAPMSQNFLVSSHHVGKDTIGSSRRNANLQLRPDPVIPRVNVGPWMNSTIERDANICKVLE
jgi:hypothetical protein